MDIKEIVNKGPKGAAAAAAAAAANGAAQDLLMTLSTRDILGPDLGS
jgi:hypothetical protein